MDYKVVITTSGIGSRLGELTKTTNKALVEINGRPTIDYILDSYTPDVPIVVTTRYLADQVETFLAQHHPNRHFIFSREPDQPVSNAAFSLGASLLHAQPYLQSPFIFHCCDTIVTDPVPAPEFDWNGGSKGLDKTIFNPQSYSSFDVDNHGIMTKLNPKGIEHFDYFHIGLVGIHSYQHFWQTLTQVYDQNPKDDTLNDVSAIRIMMQQNHPFKVVDFPHWYDTGNPQSFAHAQKNLH